MKAPILALQFMTRLPIPAVAADDGDFARAIRWFPLAGVCVGGCVAGAAWLGTLRDAPQDSWAGALLGLLAWAAITGALHLDGLADIADAAGAAHKDRARISAVLADPHIGSFGVVAIALQLVAKLVALHLWLTAHPAWELALIPAMARIAPLFWARALPPLHEGLGSRFREGASFWVLALWCALAAGAGIVFVPMLLLGFPAALAWGWWLKRRIGGISGDGHGAGIEVLETAMLLAVALA